MGIYFANKIYKDLYRERQKIDINKIKTVILNIYITNNINYIPVKILYLIIYLVKNNFCFKLINKIVHNILSRSLIKISKFMYKILQVKWLNIIEIAKINNVEKDLFNYFFELYNLYLKNEKNMDMYKYHMKYIFNIRIGFYRQFKKFIISNIYSTYFFIPIIFSKINKLNIKIENIYIT